MTQETALEGLLDTAFDVVRRYKSFGSYGSEAAAVRALHRRCSEFSKEQCREAFCRATLLFEFTTDISAKHKDHLTLETPELAEIVHAEIRRSFLDFSASTCRSALSWVFYWKSL